MAPLSLMLLLFLLLQHFQCIFANIIQNRGLGVWSISDFHVFTATNTSSTPSSISFTFPNSSTATTTCMHEFAAGSSMSAADPRTYYTCQDSDVTFEYGGSWLAVTTIVADNGSLTTTFGNTTLAQQCYSTSVSLMNGETCEMPTSEISIPILESTIISNFGSLASTVKARISNALAEISEQSASSYANGMQKRWPNTTKLMEYQSSLDERQLGSVEVGNFVGQNFDAVAGAASDVGFDINVPTLGIMTHCSLTRTPGQGSAAVGTFQPCDNPAVSYNWTTPLSVATKVAIPNVISGTTTTLSANVSLTGLCVNVANNGSNMFSAGNLCLSTATALGDITAVVDNVGSAASSLINSVFGLSTTSPLGVPPSTASAISTTTSSSIPLGVTTSAPTTTTSTPALSTSTPSSSTLSYLAYNGTTTNGQTQVDAYDVAIMRVCMLLIAYLLS